MEKIGNNIEYPAAVMIHISKKSIIPTEIKNQYTDGKFVTMPEYKRLIRLKKLKEIENGKNS